mmetsp:Transcript_99110/g.191464  ORF Transcript_99110/g.191464 Transcript_99110/m.191464 type:complete len:141 (+) Transcript_99110:94-516(+)
MQGTPRTQHIVWGRLDDVTDKSNDSAIRSADGNIVIIPTSSSDNSSSAVVEPATPADHAASTKQLAKARRPEYSLGSDGHSNNECKPCAWHWKASGCSNGIQCTFCHLCSSTALKEKRKKRIAELHTLAKEKKKCQYISL